MAGAGKSVRSRDVNREAPDFSHDGAVLLKWTVSSGESRSTFMQSLLTTAECYELFSG
jgi:hypothetical protein